MARKVLLVLLALTPGAALLAEPDRMLCLHRNGEVRVEPIEPSCCRGETTPSCPDEECQDLPIVETSPISSPEAAALMLDFSWALVEPPAELPPMAPVPRLHRPRSFSGPPPPGPERHLTTVVLRH
jgi:hypothetical protein